MNLPKTKIGKYTVTHYNHKEFSYLKREIFSKHCYFVDLEKDNPTIIDAGAHIGMATLYFMQQFPNAHVISIEANPLLIPVLEENVWQNRLEDFVEVHNIALSDKDEDAILYIDPDDEWHSTGSLYTTTHEYHKLPYKKISVPGKPLSHFLQHPVDILKLDIEGAEFKVLKAAKKHLQNIDTILLEYHPQNTGDKLEEMLALLSPHFDFDRSKKDILESKGLQMIVCRRK